MLYYAEILMMNNLLDKLLCATSYMRKSRRTLKREWNTSHMHATKSEFQLMNGVKRDQVGTTADIAMLCPHRGVLWLTDTHNVHTSHTQCAHQTYHLTLNGSFSTISTFSTLASPTAQHAASEHPSIPSSISRNMTSDTKCLINNGGIWEAQIGLFSL